jgi:hypothetical protein
LKEKSELSQEGDIQILQVDLRTRHFVWWLLQKCALPVFAPCDGGTEGTVSLPMGSCLHLSQHSLETWLARCLSLLPPKKASVPALSK